MPLKSGLLFLDFESFYDTEYSLTKLAPPNYILDRRWETIGLAAREGGNYSEYIDAPDIPAYLAQFDPKATTTVCFNALFDNCVLAWRYNFVPRHMLCTMRMAVALRGHVLQRHSLRSVGESLGVGVKGTTIEGARGKRRADIQADVGFYRAYQAYAINDNEMNAEILFKLWPEFPPDERRVMDRVLRMTVEPQLHIDAAMLQQHLIDLEAEKVELLQQAGIVDGAELRSTDKFVKLLEARGVDIQYKPSMSDPAREIPALAKTDEFMSSLLEHEDTVVQALAAARLGVRSTIEQTRTARLLSIAQLDWSGYRGGNALLPFPVKYSGAHTHRLSGEWSLNLQNLPAGRNPAKPTKLRKGIVCGPDEDLVVADLAQIECRLNAWFCGQLDLLNLFRTGADPYSVLASAIFGMVVDKKTDGGVPRFIGKSGELGLGFGCGDAKFYNMVVRAARGLGMDVKALLKIWNPTLALRSVEAYRQTHQAITSMWRTLDNAIRTSWIGQGLPTKLGPVEIGHGYIEGPGGLRMQYGNPRQDGGEFYYDYGGRSFKMYGSKMLENIIQFLARIVLMNAALRIESRTGLRFAMQAHDELGWVVPKKLTELFKQVVEAELTRCPSWAPGIPLGAEVKHGANYGEAK